MERSVSVSESSEASGESDLNLCLFFEESYSSEAETLDETTIEELGTDILLACSDLLAAVNTADSGFPEGSNGEAECIKIPTRRRNTIADIFRWLVDLDSKPAEGTRKSLDSSSRPSLSFGPTEEEERWSLWAKIVNDWTYYWKKKNTVVKDLIRAHGIPGHYRGIVWQFLCGARDGHEKFKFIEYVQTTSACEMMIRRDIDRTYPEHDYFKEKEGQEALFNVMKAYSVHDREVGYCQGSAFIVGLLLMHMQEAEAFSVLVKLMEDYRLRELFTPTMAKLGLQMYQLEMLIEEQHPDLSAHFTSQGIHTSMYASSWFLTIFTTTLSIPIASRIMDWFLLDGSELIFRASLGILTLSKTELLSLDMEGVIKFLQKDLPARVDADPESLFQLITETKVSPKILKRLEKDYGVIKRKEEEELVELGNLRHENTYLKQRIQKLEKESSELAQQLLKDQVGRAEEAETSFGLKEELEVLERKYLNTVTNLDSVTAQYHKLVAILREANLPSSLDWTNWPVMESCKTSLNNNKVVLKCHNIV